MSPILDSIGSVKAFGWGKILSSTAFESIASVTVGSGGASNVEFTSIPGTYTHLQIRYIARGTSDSETANGGIYFKFNNNFLTASHRLHGNGSAAAADASSGGLSTGSSMGFITGSSANSSIFGVGIVDILDYTNTNKNTTLRNLSGDDLNGSGFISLVSAFWNNTAAITSISMEKKDAIGGFAQYSQFALYGCK